MMFLTILVAAVVVLPSDRLAMADRLFNKGKYAEAEAEYRALVSVTNVAEDEITFRLAECDRVAGRSDAARAGYAAVFTKHPESSHADYSRFLYAMGMKGIERRKRLAELDSDRVAKDIRTAALYYLGSETSDADLLAKCVKLDPKGKYADYANLKYGNILHESSDPALRRKGVEILLGIAFGKSPMAEDALYMSAIHCYLEKRYGEAGSLFRRYRKTYPNGTNAADVRVMAAWCDFMEGRYADAAALCGESESDDLAYIRAACAYSVGDNEKALGLFKKYLEDYPSGQYRADAELPIARIEFDAAQKAQDSSATIESAKRGFGLSKLAADQLRLAWAYEKAGKTEDAKAEYQEIAVKHPGGAEAAEAMYRKALIDAREGNWSATELALSEALASDKLGAHKADALYWRGVAAIRIGHEAEGVELLDKAQKAGLGLDETREARLMIADYDVREGRLEKAKAAYAELVRDGACERMNAARILAVGKMLEGVGAETCARALVKSEAPEWRQAGWTLLGECEERREAFAAAIDAYEKGLNEKTTTEAAATAALRLGILQFRAGAFDKADAALKKAIALNSADADARAEAYLFLAKNASARNDWDSARAYLTVVTSLFEGRPACAEAQRLTAKLPEAKERE